jgi:hypothetical protein
MMRQPDFVDADFAAQMLSYAQKNKPNELLNQVQFETIEEGNCIQMLHLGPYEEEPESFAKMEEFAKQEDWNRLGKSHKEIYLSDARKVAPEKLKTVLRFQVQR